MKANQAFKNNDEAVSPVIGVILMVAITVVLAAVVFVLVTKLAGNQKDQAPNVTFSRKDATSTQGGSLTVVSIQGGAVSWADVCVKNAAGAIVGTSTANTNCGSSNAVVTTSCTLPAGTRNVEAGDVITCTGSGAAFDGPFTLYHDASGSSFYTVQFHS